MKNKNKNRIKLSNNFYLDEFTKSATAERYDIPMFIKIDSLLYRNIKRLVTDVLQPLRTALGPVVISSGYRPTDLNKLVCGIASSQHLTAQAVDLRVIGSTAMEVSQWLDVNNHKYDQLILEYGYWTHVSIPECGAKPRQITLTAVKQKRLLFKNRTIYLKGLMTQQQARARL